MTSENMDNAEHCPHCNANLQDEPIPEEHQESYGGKTHFSRKIGVTNTVDRASYWMCPDCEGTWERHERPVLGAFRTTQAMRV